MALRTGIQEVAQGLDNTDDPTLLRLIATEFRTSLGDQWRPSSNRETNEWLKLAQQLRDSGNSAREIKMEIRRQVQTSIANR
jgi:hypothetical protein